jgi:hypothetical protein
VKICAAISARTIQLETRGVAIPASMQGPASRRSGPTALDNKLQRNHPVPRVPTDERRKRVHGKRKKEEWEKKVRYLCMYPPRPLAASGLPRVT